jgi:hypothetical protein
VLHPIEDIYNFSRVSNINNKIQPDIDMSYDNSHVPTLLLLGNDNIGSNQPGVLQPERLLWLRLLGNQDCHD